jgi:acylphosphatase
MPTTTKAGPLVTGPGEPPGGPGVDPGAEPRESEYDVEGWDDVGYYAGPLASDGEPGAEARLTAWVNGRVQGVGFRWWVRRNALELGLIGAAENLVDGRVKIIAEGGRDGLVELLGRLEGSGTPGQVAQVTHRWDPVRGGFSGFIEL